MITLIDLLEIQRLKSGSDDLFDLLNGAQFDERIDREVLNNKILSDLGACIPLYDTTDTFRVFYNNYFKVKAYTIKELLDTLEYEYNPIWNKDGTITVEREGSFLEKYEREGKEVGNSSGRVTATESGNNVVNKTNVVDGEVVNLVSAENVSDYQANEKNTNDTTTTDNETSNSSSNRTETNNANENRTTNSKDEHTSEEGGKETRVEQGNIGVTSTQSLIEEQRSVVKFNIYDWLINDIKNELFVLVY